MQSAYLTQGRKDAKNALWEFDVPRLSAIDRSIKTSCVQ